MIEAALIGSRGILAHTERADVPARIVWLSAVVGFRLSERRLRAPGYNTSMPESILTAEGVGFSSVIAEVGEAGRRRGPLALRSACAVVGDATDSAHGVRADGGADVPEAERCAAGGCLA